MSAGQPGRPNLSDATRAHIRALVDAAPPLSEATRARLATILRPGIERVRASAPGTNQAPGDAEL